MKFGSKVVHGYKQTRNIQSKATPIYQTSVFSFSSLEELESYYTGESPYLYSRVGNPNTDELGQTVAGLEGAPSGVAASSGLGAILAGILGIAQAGDHLIAAKDLYGGTYHLLATELSAFGISVSFVDFANKQEIVKAIRKETKLLFSETVTNPFLRIENIAHLSTLAKQHELSLMIDNTFSTPYFVQPYKLGADVVVHSATKYIGGHSDVTAGVIIGGEQLMGKVREKVVNLGLNLSPFEAWLASRGVKTLALRMNQQARNAERLAQSLRQHNKIKKVYYPDGLSHKGNGAIVTIELVEGVDMSVFFTSLSWIKIVPSLAGVETTVSYPLGTSHRALPKEAQEELGINERVVRISVGIEEEEDIVKQFQDALSHIKMQKGSSKQ
ncbi:aminotransferase class I/II-fold pyridoxal phosphate-dependent enzyme [Bacillus spongiae]|uniref:Aminotransferase class I/II-fold pyridoxal phosphate-dependent enzyme n=1 Tax=Bacillus spongiae TaxID=2683610 RepID=A0ABU8HEM7_9BACI